MDSSPGALMEEYELMNQPKYRVYMSNIDKALKNFEYSSEWADLISALGKLNKVISSYPQYQIIPRRIKISKRLAQCMHPALPSGVHLRALESYDVIFSNTGTERLATELFIYSAGLFPLLGYAAMNVRPTLLGIYEKYFVPLGERLRPALSGFLSGVLPGYESGLDHFERTNSLLNHVCSAVSPIYFYTCLWECVATNASIRLPAVAYVLDHFNKKLGMQEQKYYLGKNHDVIMSALCSCLNDSLILVQRNTLEFLLLAFPMHTSLLANFDLIRLVTNALNTILRRDMSLNRRLYSWLLGTEISKGRSPIESDELSIADSPQSSYFHKYSKDVLIKALRLTLKLSLDMTPVDLKPYKILVSLLDKVEIGPVVLDHVMCDVIRTMSLSTANDEVKKSGNLLFATFDPAYIWDYMIGLYDKACNVTNGCSSKLALNLKNYDPNNFTPEVDAGPPNLIEVCYLTEYLLETITLEMYNETTRVYLPKVFLAITQMLTIHSENLSHDDIIASLKLCTKIVLKVQPVIISPIKHNSLIAKNPLPNEGVNPTQVDGGNSLEKSKSDSKLNQSLLDEEQPIKRSNSNHNMSKKSPKKTKKSKSYSKLLELDKDICSDTGQLVIPAAISTPNLEFPIANKKTKSKKSPITKLRHRKHQQEIDLRIVEDISPSLTPTPTPTSDTVENETSSKNDEVVELRETTMQEYSILEQCIKQYEVFYQIYVSRQALSINSKKVYQNRTCSVTVNLVQDKPQSEIDNQQRFLVSDEIIEGDSTDRVVEVDKLFETLKINVTCRLTNLQHLLNETLIGNSSTSDSCDNDIKNESISSSENRFCDNKCVTFDIKSEKQINKLSDIDLGEAEKKVCHLMDAKLNESLRASIKLASNLLVDMSTFPNYNRNLIMDQRSEDIPSWLKVLTLVACYSKADKELQISAISTLFELVSSLNSQVEHTTNPGVTFVYILPLITIGHVKYLENRTRVFQVLTSTLWDYLADENVNCLQTSSLLYQLHNCLESGLVEKIIAHRIGNTHLEWPSNENVVVALPKRSLPDSQKQVIDIVSDEKKGIRTNRLEDYKTERLSDIKIMCTPPAHTVRECSEFLSEGPLLTFKKFEMLWHLGRERDLKGFDKTVLKMFDFLALSYHVSMRTFVTKWLQESLLRGDLNRLLKPLLLIALAPNTKRIGVINAHLIKKGNDVNQSDIWFNPEKSNDDDGNDIIIEKDVYAVSSEDGNIRYHMENASNKKRSPIRSLQKKFFGVSLSAKSKQSLEKNGSASENNSNISLIINPLDNSSDIDNADSDLGSLSSSAPTKMMTDGMSSLDIQNPSLKDDYFSSCDEESESSSVESDSENRENSIDKELTGERGEILEPIVRVKRFVGDCNRVTEVLTEHDRTKNRKTYPVTQSRTLVIEKMELSITEVTDGIGYLEESTLAEEYFSTSSSNQGVVEHLLNDLIDQAVEKSNESANTTNEALVSPDINKRKKQRNKKVDRKSYPGKVNSSKELDNQQTDDKKFYNYNGKRFSNGSKISTDSNQSSDSKDKSISTHSTDSYSEHEIEIDNSIEKTITDGVIDDKMPRSDSKLKSIHQSSKESDVSEKLQRNIIKPDWEETLKKSKENVEILRQNSVGNVRRNSEMKKLFFDKLHPLHTHILLYYGVFDTKQVLYSIQTLRNIIASDCRTFLCLSMTTSVADTQIKNLLIRHRKSIFGKGFTGIIANTEFSHAYRGCMYLEALVTLCLYYLRSYFQKTSCEGNKLPSSEDIRGNCKIQLASIELLTLLCSQLIPVVQEMGKGLACYIADLITKCKLQKIVIHCILSSVHSFTFKDTITFTDEIIRFNNPDDEKLHSEALQIELLRLLLAVIKLEYEITMQKGEENSRNSSTTENNSGSQSPTRPGPSTPTNIKFLTNCPISQQPMFLSAVLNALQANHLRHLHKNWTDVVTSSLGCFAFGSLTNIVISVIHQICTNIDDITNITKVSSLPPDYTLAQLEALTVLSHYCLLDNSQQMTLSHVFNQAYPPANSSTQTSNPGQILNNLVHVFLSTPLSAESQSRNAQHMAARNAVLSHLPRIVASVAALWDHEIGQARLVSKQLLEFLSPISLHHGVNFLAAVAVAWQERGDSVRKIQSNQLNQSDRKNSASSSVAVKALPHACPEQLSLVNLVSGIRIMPMDSFVQTLHQVVKTPPAIHHPPAGLSLDVSALELFYFYMKNAPASQLNDSWSSLLALLRDGLSLSPPAQFVLLVILNEFVQRCPQMPFQDKKDLRDLHDITSRLVEALSNVAGACLEQTTWLRRNLAVKEDFGSSLFEGSLKESTVLGNQQYSVQSQTVLACVLANLLDVAYGSQEKDKVVTIVTTLMYNITPYLKNHTVRNIPSFYACSNLLASLSTYQYTRKAWRKDVLDLLLDPTFFQMDISCLPFWKSILDSLMTYDNTTFRELMNRVSLTQTGSLNIFASKEQEYELRASMLKRLAFVIFCSELDQYQKYMPEIQEQLANSLRLPQVVPSVQAAVFLCFRVLLLRMSPDHVTSLWPIIIAEMVQVLLSIEQELKTDTEEFSQHIRVLSGLDSTWVTNTNNGLYSNGHPQWRMVQLETAKLLELGCVLPATNLPHFQMYRWAFVGGLNDYVTDNINGDIGIKSAPVPSSVFIPHVTRIARLMDYRYTSHSPKTTSVRGKHLVLTCQSIASLQDLYGFFSTLSVTWPPYQFGDADKEIANCLLEIETILAADFLEKMPSLVSAR